jgi:hypothetical protein
MNFEITTDLNQGLSVGYLRGASPATPSPRLLLDSEIAALLHPAKLADLDFGMSIGSGV